MSSPGRAILALVEWYPEPELNRYVSFQTRDFKFSVIH